MKKILSIAIFALIILAIPVMAMAAGNVTQSLKIIPNSDKAILTFSFIGDSGGGTLPATPTSATITEKIQGMYIIQVVTNPGLVAPTTLWDVTITDDDGLDLMGGTMADRSETATQRAIPKIDTTNGIFGGAIIPGTITLNITGNSVNSATGTVILYLSK